jgi:hypothetical protein
MQPDQAALAESWVQFVAGGAVVTGMLEKGPDAVTRPPLDPTPARA